MAARANRARATELTVVGHSFFAPHYTEFIEQLKIHSDEGDFNTIALGGVNFHHRCRPDLINYLEGIHPNSTIGIDGVTDIYHLDGISKPTKVKIADNHNCAIEDMEKADLFVVANSGGHCISVKDDTTKAKQGQGSKKFTYGDVVISGGHTLVSDEELLSKSPPVTDFTYHETDLTSTQFNKLGPKNKKFAYVKKNHTMDWEKHRDLTLQAALDSLKRLEKGFHEKPTETVVDWLSQTLYGNGAPPDNYYLYSKGTLCSLGNFVAELKKGDWWLHTVWKKATKKTAVDQLILSIIWNDTAYTLTKIQPSYDGGERWKTAKKEKAVSQTKGIINYFQEYPHPKSGKTIWDLLLDITNLIVSRQSLISNQPSVGGDEEMNSATVQQRWKSENGGEITISKHPQFRKGRRGKLEKVISLTGGGERVSRVLMDANNGLKKLDSPHDSFESSWLKLQKWPRIINPKSTIRSCDLFSGCGGITMGLWEACRNYEMKLEVVMGCDLFDAAESSFVANFSPEFFLNQPIEQYVNGELGAELTPEEKLLKERLGRIHVVVGGPPCQGNSNLNNHTRRTDSRNELYMRMIRFIEIIQPDIALIENVSGVMRAKQNVVQRSNEYLNNLGYVSRHGVVKGVNIGIPQTRVRHFTVAVKDGNDFSFDEIGDPTFESPRPVSWAIADLLGIEKGDDIFNNPPSATPVNQKRMDYLFEHEIYNLPNKERPPCQQKAHTYPAIYSRMWWDKPAPTLTTGFGCNGRGRFTHPKEARVLTPHEAARVQTFPDFFDFTIIKKRTDLHRLIGNAVPPLMATHVLVPLLDNFLRLQGVNN